MNMKSSNKKISEIEETFIDIFSFEEEEDKFEVDAKVLMAKFLSLIQETYEEKGLKRNELAHKIGTSPSYLTQLFRGHKLINLTTLVKLQAALDIKFDIKLDTSSKLENPINEDNIAEYLDKWYESNRSGAYLKVLRNFSAPARDENDYNFDFSDTKSYAI